MADDKLFEAFFYIEPTRVNPIDPFQATRVVYNIPADVQDISKEFRDVSQFCFPGIFIIIIQDTI